MSRFVEHFRAIVGNHGTTKSESKQTDKQKEKEKEKARQARIAANRKNSSVSLPHISRSDFQVGAMIGQGSFATVHKAKHIASGRDVAIKVVRPESELDFGTGPNGSSPGVCYDDVLKAMKLEVKIVETLGKHPYLIELLGTADDCKVFVMERAASDLYTIVKKQGTELPLQLAAQWSEQMLTATVYMHEMGIVHQDIKSSNVLIFPDRTAKMCDFGLARQSSKVMCVDRELITLWYRAPELLMGEAVYSEKVDEWGVGTILLEMLVGHSPFRGRPECFCSCPQITHRNYNSDQLMKVFAMCGTPRERTFLARSSCSNHFSKWPFFPRKLESTVSKSINEDRCLNWIPGKPRGEDDLQLIASEWASLIGGLLELDPEKRMDAQAGLDIAAAWTDNRPRGPRSPKTPVEHTSSSSPPVAAARAKATAPAHPAPTSSSVRRKSLTSASTAPLAHQACIRRTVSASDNNASSAAANTTAGHSAANTTAGHSNADMSTIRRSCSDGHPPAAGQAQAPASSEARTRTLRRRGSETSGTGATGSTARGVSASMARRKSLPGQRSAASAHVTTVQYTSLARRSSDASVAAAAGKQRRGSLSSRDTAGHGEGLLRRTCSDRRGSASEEDVHG